MLFNEKFIRLFGAVHPEARGMLNTMLKWDGVNAWFMYDKRMFREEGENLLTMAYFLEKGQLIDTTKEQIDNMEIESIDYILQIDSQKNLIIYVTCLDWTLHEMIKHAIE